eukprot:TRINITY_DN4844_c0_g5_i1.p3 TRINITY_DN4844_c0_g5~~TRINITY_DN4844_c0_g5_i1.p3  ORF type:complete len:128 (+),score=24.54 TRINITY_DN4844_c0_g5_i1:66-449(+)
MFLATFRRRSNSISANELSKSDEADLNAVLSNILQNYQTESAMVVTTLEALEQLLGPFGDKNALRESFELRRQKSLHNNEMENQQVKGSKIFVKKDTEPEIILLEECETTLDDESEKSMLFLSLIHI